jgi:hypothetical protein
MIMYFAVFRPDSFDWLSVFLFSACAVMRLARFNIEQAGTAKTYFQGLPSPAAGITLASYYWFSQSWLYNYGAIANLKWHVLLRFLMAALSFLMISNIPYPVFPRTGFRSLRAIGATLLLVGSMTLLATKRLEFFFPAALCYVAWGPIRWVFAGLFERRQPTIPYDLSEGEDDEEEDEEDAFGPMDSQVHAMRQSERETRAAHVERERPRRERPERGERGERGERPERAERSERPTPSARGERAPRGDATQSSKSERAESTDRAATSERPARGERSEADRAARREKRDKREKRREREARAAAANAAEPPETGVGAITLGASPSEVTPAAPVLSVVRAEAEPVASADAVEVASAEAGPARKRKRRRRRGQRDRSGADTPGSIETADAGDAADTGDTADGGDFEDAPDAGERSPYASTERHANELRGEPGEAPATRAPEPSAPPPPPTASAASPPVAPQSSTPLTDNNE